MTRPPLLLVLMLLLLTGAAVSRAQTTATANGEELVDQQRHQQQISLSTQKVGQLFDGLLQEFERNGLGGDEVKSLRAIRSSLDRLSEKEMAQVVALLQQAHGGTEDNAREKASSAYSGQKGIILQMRTLLFDYQRQQALHDLGQRFAELAERQGATLNDTVALAGLIKLQKSTRFTPRQTLALQLQSTQQKAIQEETAVALDQLQQLATAAAPEIAERARPALEKSQKEPLKPSLLAAVEALQKAQLAQANAPQKKVRELLGDLANLLGASSDPLEIYSRNLAELDQLLQQQKVLLQQTRQLGKNVNDAQPLARRQNELADRTGLLQKDLANFSSMSAETLKSAMGSMQRAQEALSSKNSSYSRRDAAVPHEVQALAGLELAKKQLTEQLAKADQLVKLQPDPLPVLTNLLAQVRDLKSNQEKLAGKAADLAAAKTKAPEQTKLKEQAAALQSEAAMPATEAAKALGKASAAMSQAAEKMKQSAPAAPSHQEALQNLAEAEKQLEEKVKAMEKAREELAKLEELNNKVESALAAEQKLQLETAKAKSPETMDDLAKKQEAVAAQTGALEKEAAKAAPKAAGKATQAQKKMEQAKDQLQKKSSQAAQASQKEALQELRDLKESLQEQMDELAQAAGVPPPDATEEEMAEALDALEQAKEEVNLAQEQLKLGEDPRPALPPLEKAANLVSPLAAMQKSAQPGSPARALQQAHDALVKATNQASNGAKKPTEQSTQEAKEALAKATDALEKAKEAKSMQAKAGNKPGQGKGKGKGKGKGEGEGEGEGKSKGKGQGQGEENKDGTGENPNAEAKGRKSAPDGERHATHGSGRFTALPLRDRAAIQQSQSEKYPQEYGAAIEQYLRNLSDESTK